ncbi:MAG: type II toxin-antitoxin system VapC family toxin [Candidatus Competibacteraceae bacterium]|nr:type II toxin-antitoxin system VapC family toxin [Candidatus Competibacteraceae bacterium]
MAAEPLFVDSNVLAYAQLAESPWHEPARQALQQAAKAQRPLWISRQVIREYAVIMSRPQTFAQPLSSAVLIKRIGYLQQHFQVADETAAVTAALLQLLENYPIGGKQVHDANLLATMQVQGIRHLLTHNAKDFARFGDLLVVESLVNTA